MSLFQYSGRNQRGEAVSGHIEAGSADAVATQLFNNGITPVDITVTSASADVLAGMRDIFGEPKVQLTDLILFSRQMYTLLKAGVPIMQALKGLEGSTHNPTLVRVIGEINESLDAGLDLTSALRRHTDVFSTLYISMVQVGETTGALQESFLQMSSYLELEKDTRERVKSATRYPMFVVVSIAIAIFVINLFVIPAFTKVYASFGADLPWATKMLIATSNFTVAYWYVILIVLGLAALGLRVYVKTTEGRYRWHKLKLRLPAVGGIIYRATLGRFARALALTIKAGVPLVQGLTVVSRAVDNEYVGGQIGQMRDGVERGETITRTAAATGMFPPMVLQMLTVGEETGAVDELMGEVAGYYEREVDYDLKNLSDAIQPILIIFIGILVFILALGVFLPMWDLPQAMKGG